MSDLQKQLLIDYLKQWAKEQRQEGIIPTVDLLIEDLAEQLKTK